MKVIKVLISVLAIVILSSFVVSNFKTSKTMTEYSCTIYVKNEYGNPACCVQVRGYYSKSVWSDGSTKEETDRNGKVVLKWYSNKPLKVIWVWYKGFNYYYYGTFEDGGVYTIRLDKSHIE